MEQVKSPKVRKRIVTEFLREYGGKMNKDSDNLMFEGETSLAIVQVLLPQALPIITDYLIEAASAVPGSFVRVPLGTKERIGVIWGAGRSGIERDKLREVIEIIKAPRLTKEHREFIDFVARYTLSNEGAVLRLTLNTPKALEAPPTVVQYIKTDNIPDNMTSERTALMEQLLDFNPRTVRQLSRLGGVSEGVVRGLISCGALTGVNVAKEKPYPSPQIDLKAPKLSKRQKEVAAVLSESVARGSFDPILIDGVTGSGKTEVYFEAIIAALKNDGSQVLVLLPEIALTAQWLKRFEDRFGCRPIEWHSDLSSVQRARAWRAVNLGKARVVVGARSALFLPFQNLQLIIVDEEHDGSFKQEEGVIYHARDMAVLRAKQADCPIILASATPSFESHVNAIEGKYKRLVIHERHGVAGLPDIEAVDMRNEQLPADRFVSEPLIAAIEQALKRSEQTLLFLNRRGYAPLTLCRICGERIECPHCSAWLVEHRYKKSLECHHCGHSMPKPTVCPTCHKEDGLAACGPGVERLTEEVANIFPEARLMVMTSDTLTSPKLAAEQIAAITENKVDIVIGTQIITKGYHFPQMTVVGIIDGDLGLKGADLRAAERTYQQLAQVSGRAGREAKEGRVILQTYMPDHPVAQSLISGDIEAFRDGDLEGRKLAGMPPFGKLAALIVSGNDEGQVVRFAKLLAREAPRGDKIQVLGPAPAPLSRLRGQYRYRLLVISKGRAGLQAMIRKWLTKVPQNKFIQLKIDIDPQSFQ